jgi:excisionase family DNA binding protein
MRRVPDRNKAGLNAGVERLTYTVEELCRVLGRNRMGVYEDLRKGRIPSRRLGTRYIISRKAIERWLEGDETAA